MEQTKPNARRSYDVAVVGAGIVGASCAYHLTRRGLSVVVLESMAGPAAATSGRSFAGVRSQWSDSLNIEISWRSIAQYRDFERDHGIPVAYRPIGYMFLVPGDLWDQQREAAALQRSHGVPTQVLSVDDAQAKTPFDATEIAGATWGPADGVVDPVAVTQAFLTLARREGCVVLFRHPVTRIEQGQTNWRITVRDGDVEVEAAHVVNAAGGWAGELAALAGIDVPVEHSRRCIYSTGSMPDFGPVPTTVDMGTSVYLRSEGQRVLFALGNTDEPSGLNLAVDWGWRETVLQRAVTRFPWLADAPLDEQGSWAGTYEITPDHLPILGRSAAAPTWINACGFSGHGVMQAPMAGQLVAEEVADGATVSLDIDPLRGARFTNGSLVNTRMVY